MLDDRVVLVALDHADVEEAGVLAVHHRLEHRALAVAMVLRRLHQAHGGVAEVRHQVPQPVLVHDVVGIDHRDHFGVRRRHLQCLVQGAGLEARELGNVEELEARAERLAMRLDRLPVRLLGRVVDDHHRLEIRIVERGDAVQRLLQHLRRLAIGRDVDRDARRIVRQRIVRQRTVRQRRAAGHQAHRPAAEKNLRHLVDLGERHDDQRNHQQEADRPHDRGADGHVVGEGIGRRHRDAGAHCVGREAIGERVAVRRAASQQAEQRERGAEAERRQRHRAIARVRQDRPGERELGAAVGIEDAPVGADAALFGLPRLIEGFDDVVVDAARARFGDEAAHHLGLQILAGGGVAVVVALARPAELGDHDLLAGERAAQLVVAQQRVVDGRCGRHALPVRQDVRRDEVDLVGELRIAQPDVPGLSGGHRDVHPALDLANVRDQRVDAAHLAQDRLVAGDDRTDVEMAVRQLGRRLDLRAVQGFVAVQPGADRYVELEFLRQRRHCAQLAEARVGANGSRHPGYQPQAVLDLRQAARPFLGRNLLARGLQVERQRLDEILDVGRRDRPGGDPPGHCMHCSRHDERRENRLLHGNPWAWPSELGFRPRARSKVLRLRRARL